MSKKCDEDTKKPRKRFIYESETNVTEIIPEEKDFNEEIEENRTKIRNAVQKCMDEKEKVKDCGEEFADMVDEDLEKIRKKVRQAEKDNVLYNITTDEYNKVSTVKKNPKTYIADYEKCIVYKITSTDRTWQKSQKDYFDFVRKFI